MPYSQQWEYKHNVYRYWERIIMQNIIYKTIRSFRYAILVTLGLLIITSNVANSGSLQPNQIQPYPTGINILIYYDNAVTPTSNEYNGLKTNFTNAGNTVKITNQTNFDFTSDELSEYDALLISIEGSTIFDAATNPDVVAINDWFDTGNKLLWVAGADDFGNYWRANQTNPLLEAIGTPLRFDAGGMQDFASNDGAAYRVLANSTGTSSPLVDYVSANFTNAFFFAPTAINYHDGSKITDLRNASLPQTIDIVLNSSRFATIIDQDLSQGEDDYYINSATVGSYPMVAVDHNSSASNSMLVLSGEKMFSDYKFMYGSTRFYDTSQSHDGSMVVDKLMSYYFVEVLNDINNPEHSSSTSTTSTITTTKIEPTSLATSPVVVSTVDNTVTVADSEETVGISLPKLSFYLATLVVVVVIKRSKN